MTVHTRVVRRQNSTRQLAGGSTRTVLMAAVAVVTLAGGARVASAADGTWAAGSGTWSVTANWAGGVVADGAGATATFNQDLTADTVVSLDTARTLGNLTFGDTDTTTAGSWVVNNAGVAGNVLTLSTGSAVAPTITVGSMGTGKSVTLSGVIAGTSGFVKSGAGELVLSGSNTITGAATATASTPIITINAGTVAVSGTTTATVSANAGGTGSVLVNGGTLAYIGTSGGPTFTHMITIGSNGGTLESRGVGSAGKWVLNGAGKLDGSGTLTKIGPGWLTIFSASSFTGNTIVKDGVLENGSITGVGTGRIDVIGGTANATDANSPFFTGGGMFSHDSTAAAGLPNEIHVNLGTLAVDNGSNTFAGQINFDGPAKIQLGDFFGGTARNITFNGNSTMVGSGNITLVGAQGAATGAGQTLNINGDYTSYGGLINVPAGFNVNFGGAFDMASDTLIVNSSATALGGVGAAVGSLHTITDNTGTFGGVLGINGGSTGIGATALDLSTLFGGSGMWYLGAQGNGTYSASSLGVGAGNTYRLGGGGGTLTITSANVVTGNNALNIGAAMANGGGTIKFGAAQNYTGATNIISGTLGLAPGVTNTINPNTVVTMGGLNGTTKFAGTLDLNGSSQTLNQPILVATGADPTAQTILNNGTTTGTLTIDTSTATGPQTFSGPVKDGTKPLAIVVQGTNAANTLALTNAGTSVTGGVTVNKTTLTVGPASGAPNAAKVGGPITFANNGTLVLNSTANMTLGIVSGTGNLVHSGSGNVTLGANNSAFAGSITVNGGGTLTAGLSTPGVFPLSNAAITLAGGKLAVQGQMTSSGTVQSLAPVTTLTGWTADTIYAATDTKFYPNNLDKASATGSSQNDANNTLADQFYSYFQTGFTPNSTQANGQLNKGQTLTNGLSGTSFTSAITNTVTGGNTPFQFQSLTAANTLQIAGGTNGFHQGTLTLSTPSGFKNIAVLASNAFGTNDPLGMTINFTDGTTATTTYQSYDWSIGKDPSNITNTEADNHNVFKGTLINRYSPYQAVTNVDGVNGQTTPTGWDQRDFGMFETDIDLTNINGVDYSGKVVTSITFDSDPTSGQLSGNRRTNIFGLSGQAIPLIANTTQAFSNNIAVTADSSIDVTGSPNAAFGTLNLGAKLSATSATNTNAAYGVTFGATTLNGSGAVDVANSAGGGAGTVTLGAVSGSGSLTKSGVGLLKLAGGGNISGTLTLNGGTLETDANTTAGGLAGNGGALNVAAGNLAVGPSTGTAAKLSGLTVGASSKFDINNNSLVIAYGTNPSPANTIRQYLQSGQNGGAWNGTSGITSSTLGAHRGIAYAEASQLLGLSGTQTATWNGQTVDATSLLVQANVYYGDLNLDGTVNGDDYALLDRGAATVKTGWINGDVNYDGVVNAGDYLLTDASYLSLHPSDASGLIAEREAQFGSDYVAALVVAVPEPSTLAAGLLAVMPMVARRRRGK